MRMLDENEKLLRSDVHPLALVESEYAMTECSVCELPVPEDREGNIYCSQACEDSALEDALWQDKIEAAHARDAKLFVSAKAPGAHCSCC